MAMLTRRFFSTLVLTLLAAATLPAAPGRCADLVRVGEGPFITGGGFLVAREKGYFKRLGIDIDT
jgi:NitT/TauT family transport system substrate-binding protein